MPVKRLRVVQYDFIILSISPYKSLIQVAHTSRSPKSPSTTPSPIRSHLPLPKSLIIASHNRHGLALLHRLSCALLSPFLNSFHSSLAFFRPLEIPIPPFQLLSLPYPELVSIVYSDFGSFILYPFLLLVSCSSSCYCMVLFSLPPCLLLLLLLYLDHHDHRNFTSRCCTCISFLLPSLSPSR